MFNFWVASHRKSVLDAREHLEIVCALAADHDVFCTSTRGVREGVVFLCENRY